MVAQNGKTTIINPWFLKLALDDPFLNKIKNAAQLTCADASTRYDPTKHDSNGYMHTVYGTSGGGGVGTYWGFNIPSQAQRAGNYVLKWVGGGTFSVSSFSHSFVSGSLTGGRYVMTPSTTAGNIRVSAVTDPGVDYPHDVVFCHVDDEALVDAGYKFSTLFKTRIAKAGIFRALDWQLGNTSNIVNWADRMPLTYHSWAAGSIFPTARYLVTTNSGDAYTADTSGISGYSRADNAQLLLKFNASSSGTTPTLNDGGGALPLRNSYGGELSASQKPLANYVGMVTYKNRLGCWMKSGGDTSQGDKGLITGVPPELIIELCRETGMDPWFVPPYLTVDPPSDYMPGLVQLCKDTLNA